MSQYVDIQPAGGDTGASLNLRKRMRLIERWAPLTGKRALDCGCGQGQYVVAMLAAGADAYGVEYLADKVDQGRQLYPQLVGRIEQGDIVHLRFGDADFDTVLLNEVLEHVPDQELALSEISRVLKPRGLLLLFSPNRRYPFETHGVTLRSNQKRLPPATPLIPYVPLSVGGKLFTYHARNYWPGELQRLLSGQGFRVLHTDYVWQTFENISGVQPRLLSRLRPVLRQVAGVSEKLPVVRTFGVSQLVVAAKR